MPIFVQVLLNNVLKHANLPQHHIIVFNRIQSQLFRVDLFPSLAKAS